jgi:hypothetical protein
MPPTFQVVPPVDDAVAAWGIGGLAVVMAVAALAVLRRWQPAAAPGAALLVTLWMAASAWAAWSGQLARFDRRPPPMAVLIVSIFAAGFAIGLSRLGGQLARTVPLVVLVALQAFRLPLELLMHRAATRGIMLPELSYGGYNFDIVTGAGAAVLAVLMAAGVQVPRVVVWIWNVWGLWCLAVIAVVAVAGSPMVRAFGDDPRHVNTWVLFFPYVWLPAVLVTLAVAGHVVVTRALRVRAAAA